MNMSNYELPNKIGDYLETLSAIYEANGETEKAKILKTPEYTIDEEYDFSYSSAGHKLNLKVTKSVFPMSINFKIKIENDIMNDLNRLHKIKHEYIATVNLEMIKSNTSDWLKQLGAQTPNNPIIADEEMERIWGKNGFRVFMSHKSEEKQIIKYLKDQLKVFGISCFLAHEDIQPASDWELEIKKAIFSMDGLVAFMSNSFHESFWTDQELGFALALKVPIIPIDYGTKPYGFIGTIQSIPFSKNDLALEIAKTLLKKAESKEKMLDSYISAVKNCLHYDQGNELARLLPEIKCLGEKRIAELVSAYNKNRWINMSYGFNGERSIYYGEGLLPYISKWTDKKYQRNSVGEIVPHQ